MHSAPYMGMMSFMVKMHSVWWFCFLLHSGSNKSQGKFSESCNLFYWIIDELTDWKHFQDAKLKQILNFDSVVVEGGGGKYDIVCIQLFANSPEQAWVSPTNTRLTYTYSA